jgi:hypothetical protein
MTASNKNPNSIRLSTRDIRNRDKKKKKTHTIHVRTRSNHHNYPGKGDVHNDNTAGTVADLEALDTLQRNTLGTHVVAPVVGILDTLEVVAPVVGILDTLEVVVVVVGTLRVVVVVVVVVGTLRVVVEEALMASTLEAGKVMSTLSVQNQSDSKFKIEGGKREFDYLEEGRDHEGLSGNS